jgi:hypothetical protein
MDVKVEQRSRFPASFVYDEIIERIMLRYNQVLLINVSLEGLMLVMTYLDIHQVVNAHSSELRELLTTFFKKVRYGISLRALRVCELTSTIVN